MMMNLFSVFDPSSSLNFSLNWLSFYFLVLFSSLNYWLFNSRMGSFYFFISENLIYELINNFIKKKLKSFIYFFLIWYIIFFNNIMGLFPYIFTSTSHLIISFLFSLPMWFSMILQSMFNSINNMMSHLVPTGTPMYLSIFMVFIETISLVMRPLTLAIRLTANMIAGHLLLVLVSSMFLNSLMFFISSILGTFLLLILEIAVAMIQSYVFSLLLILYFNE